ncbi:MAG TPA: mandelate racemase/muconate lactonizing enzyme family protein [Gaiellaceae bacterium]|jgi:galactonate dehydratase
MRIVDVVTTVVGAPWRELTFVELVTDDGRRGVGEVRMVSKTDTLVACISELAERHVVGADPFDRETLTFNIQRREYGRPGEVTQSALAAFDIASWDLIGQELNVPVWKLLGGSYRDRVRAYANGWYQTGRDPAAIAESASDVVARGYTALKLDPFGSAWMDLTSAELRRSVALVAAVRDAVGPDVQIMIEMHGRFSPAAAAEIAAQLEPFAPAWLEEPVPFDSPTGLARVRSATRRPIATGERIHLLPDFRAIIEQGLVDIVQADLTHFGGFTGLRRLAGWAEAYDLPLAPHNVCGPVGTAANIHFAIATPNHLILEHFNDFADAWVSDLVDSAPAVDPLDGCFPLPTAPGLGVRLDHEACAEHPRTRGRILLFSEGWERRGEPSPTPP